MHALKTKIEINPIPSIIHIDTISTIPPKKRNRSIKKDASILPVRKWVSFNSACDYTEKGAVCFREWAEKNKLSISGGGRTTYYLISEIDKAFYDNIILNHK